MESILRGSNSVRGQRTLFYYRTLFASSTVFDMSQGDQPTDPTDHADPTARTFRAGPVRIRVRAGRPAPRERLSADRIVEVALDQMRAGGYEGVSMRSIARELGTGAASLYAHVANRNELDALVLERVASRLEVPDPDPARWQEQLGETLVRMLALYDEHPGVARASLGMVPMSPRILVTMERLVALLRAGGVPDQAAAWFLDLMALYVSSVAVERDVWRSREAVPDDHDDDGHHDAIHQYFRDLPEDEFPVLASMAAALATGDSDDRFRFGVDVLIAGVAAYAEGRAGVRAGIRAEVRPENRRASESSAE
jgi:AcrR family transcriptional regulator